MVVAMKILLTGGCGFIGSNFVRFVLGNRDDIEIVNIHGKGFKLLVQEH